MKVALFGATGFVGSYIVDELISQGMEANLMVREGSENKLLQKEKCRIIKGDIDDEIAINKTLDGCGAVIYAIGIIREFPCLLYTSDAADDTPCVDLGGRRIIKKKKLYI